MDHRSRLRVVLVHRGPAAESLVPPTPALDILVLAEAEALARLAAIEPHVVVLDLREAAASDLEPTIRAMRAAARQAALVVVGPPQADSIARAALLAGAQAYEGSDVTPLRVLRAVQAVAKGLLHLNATGRRAARALTRAPAAPD
jgi:DNA-binding NarL/FixJ family response regulator